MSFAEVFFVFNVVEGFLWILLAILAFYFRHTLPSIRTLYWESLASVLVIFGISDWIEVFASVSFLEPGGEWLFFIKIVCVVALIGAAIIYFYKRGTLNSKL
jgi:hypothetical protein